MPVLLVDVDEVQLDVAFGGKEYLLHAVGAFTQPVFLELNGQTDQGVGDVGEIPLREGVPGDLLLAGSLFQGEVVVVGVGVQRLMLDAELDIWVKRALPSRSSLSNILARLGCVMFLTWLRRERSLAMRCLSSMYVFLWSTMYS